MRVLISGASGLIGSELVRALGTAGHEVARLVRAEPMPGPSRIVWDPAHGWLETPRLEGFDAVVHLAGESVAESPWTAEKKARIHDSRVASTRLLAETLARLERKPAVFACASAVGYYGDRGGEELDETSPPGKGFLANVCRQWEAATGRAAAAGIRVVRMRFGLVLSQRAGAFARTLPMFRHGLGGRLGSGRQYVSWIVLDDVVAAIQRILSDNSLDGPINVVGPNPVTNLELTRTTAGVLHRPAPLPIPAFLLRLKLGEMADELVLASQRVYPRRLQAAGHTFAYPELEPAIRRLV
jgi:uncharacterized protein (TIGR01777 family)